MAKQRYIDTKFWTDNDILEFAPEIKLVYLYLLTNPAHNLCGIYEISKSSISFHTGYPIDRVSSILDTLSKKNKISYTSGWVYLKNSCKYRSTGPKIDLAIEREKKSIPARILDTLSIPYPYPMDGQSTPIPILLPKPKPKLEPKKEKNKKEKFQPPTLSQVQQYVSEQNLFVDPQGFIDFYESKGWMVGKSQMKNWQAACRRAKNWNSSEKNQISEGRYKRYDN